jgi:hypothetical protein
MVVVPIANPETTPVAELTVPTAVLELLHVPPATGFDNVVLAPRQAILVPVIVPGEATTVTTKLVAHPPKA